MTRTPLLIPSLLLIGLGGCAADGSSLGQGTASAPPAPAVATTPPAPAGTVIATTPIATPTPAPVAPAPVTQAPAPQIVDPTRGQIVLIEPIQPISKQGGSAALAIGASVLGAFIPGPWGGVASVATGQAGQYALNSASSNASRYHVRLSDGTIQTVTQTTLPALTVGASVQMLTLADGSKRLVQAPPAVPSAPVSSAL